METKFNFKSQPCTSREQSERLLALGLKKETADMIHQPIGATPFNVWDKQEIEDDFYPAWSLHRLILMTPKEIIVNNGVIFPFRGTALMDLTINNCDLYEGMVQIIERCIKEGYFNKEYLEE